MEKSEYMTTHEAQNMLRVSATDSSQLESRGAHSRLHNSGRKTPLQSQ